ADEPEPTDDPTAYRPASEFIEGSRFSTLRAIRKVLDANPKIRRRRPHAKTGKQIPNRLEIHAGDWLAFIHAKSVDPSDMPANVVDAVMEQEQRKVEIRRQKEAEK